MTRLLFNLKDFYVMHEGQGERKLIVRASDLNDRFINGMYGYCIVEWSTFSIVQFHPPSLPDRKFYEIRDYYKDPFE